jgi:spermidine synthase
MLHPIVTHENGRKVLRVGGVIQSIHVDERYQSDVWDAMLPRRQPASALILGLGGGTIASLMTQRWGPIPITGVEVDPAVVWLARHEFGLAQLPNVGIVVEDAFSYVRRCDRQFDAICVDLYTAGKLAHGVFGVPFLGGIATLLAPEGEAAFNLWRSPYLTDQLRRLRRVLTVSAIVEADENIVVHCKRAMVER